MRNKVKKSKVIRTELPRIFSDEWNAKWGVDLVSTDKAFEALNEGHRVFVAYCDPVTKTTIWEEVKSYEGWLYQLDGCGNMRPFQARDAKVFRVEK